MAAQDGLEQKCFGLLLLVAVAAALSACSSIRSEPPEPQPFKFAQICDTQLGMGGYEHDMQTFNQAVKQINALQPDFVVICGDLVGRPHKHTFDDFVEIKANFVIPCHCVPGNHDVGNVPTVETLAYYRKEVGKDYYSFRHKGYAFVCVNSQLWKAPLAGESNKHDAWLKQTLQDASDDGLPIFIVAHYPLFTAEPDEKENYYNLPLDKRQELLNLFETTGVVAVLTGHAHKVIVNNYKGIQLVTGQATSRTHGTPLGFRLWHINQQRPFRHQSIPLEGIE